MMAILRYLYSMWAAFLFAAVVLFICVPVAFITSLWSYKGLKYLMKATQISSKIWAFGTGVKYDVVGKEKLDRSQNYIFTPNHTSYGDVVILAAALNHAFNVLGKIEVKNMPLMGYLFRRTTVFVDRSNEESRRKSVMNLKERAENAISLLIFPEGTFSRPENEVMLPFYSGAFRIAIDLKMPIVPVAIVGARNLFTNDALPLRPCRITCVYADPIETKYLTKEDTNELKNRVYSTIENLLINLDPVYQKYK